MDSVTVTGAVDAAHQLDFSLMALFTRATFTVQIVMVVLIAASVWSWAIIGINVFLGMRYAEWDESRPASEIAESVADLISDGLRPNKN